MIPFGETKLLKDTLIVTILEKNNIGTSDFSYRAAKSSKCTPCYICSY